MRSLHYKSYKISFNSYLIINMISKNPSIAIIGNKSKIRPRNLNFPIDLIYLHMVTMLETIIAARINVHI